MVKDKQNSESEAKAKGVEKDIQNSDSKRKAKSTEKVRQMSECEPKAKSVEKVNHNSKCEAKCEEKVGQMWNKSKWSRNGETVFKVHSESYLQVL